jgi:hypothetical protein
MAKQGKSQQKLKRKRGKKFVYKGGDNDKNNQNQAKGNPFEEFSKKNHMKIGSQVSENL